MRSRGYGPAKPAVVSPTVPTPVGVLQRRCACGGALGPTGACAGCRRQRPLGETVPSRLRVNQPGDRFEQEADRVAARVMGVSALRWARQIEPDDEDDALLQMRARGPRKAASEASVDSGPPIVHEVLRAQGQPLDPATCGFMEARFGHEFDQVRVHTDAQAAESARTIGASAYTVGQHIVFGRGYYTPDSQAGRRLLAHELAHVIQQHQGAPQPADAIATAALDTAATPGGHVASTAGTRNLPALVLQQSPFLQLQRQVIHDPIHQPIIEDFRRRRGLPLSGRDPSGRPVGPSAGEIKYQLSIPNQLARFAVKTPWQLTQLSPSDFAPSGPHPPAWAQARFADYARARRLAQAVFTRFGVSYDIDTSSRLVGRRPNAAELGILNRNLSRILNLRNVRSLVSGAGGRGIPTSSGSSTPSLQGRVRIARNANEYGIKRYQLEMSVVGLQGQNTSALDTAVRQLWQHFRLTPGAAATVTDQERRLAVLFQSVMATGNPGFYHPGDDVIYLEPNTNLQTIAGSDVARHETVHLLGGRDQTRQAFVARYGANYLRYWSTFEEGIAELLARESRPPGQRAPAQTTTTRTAGNTTVTVTVGPGYGSEVRTMRAIMNHPQVGRRNLLRAYFTGNIPAIIFQQLEQQLGRP